MKLDVYGDLWRRYSDEDFEQSLQLFYRRFEANGFDLKWFEGKKCLDAGCGGGRYSLAMGRLGAEVVGLDLSEEGLKDARHRAEGMGNIKFRKGDVLQLPFPDEAFDFVCCSGVLHHTREPDRGLDEIARVLRTGGKCYLLVYGKGGLRWSLVFKLRDAVAGLGYQAVDVVAKRVLPVNKQRTFLDDLFVPILEPMSKEVLRLKLIGRGFDEIDFWQRGKLDHEASRAALRRDLIYWNKLFYNLRGYLSDGKAMVGEILWTWAQTWFRSHKAVFGQGNIRLLATKE